MVTWRISSRSVLFQCQIVYSQKRWDRLSCAWQYNYWLEFMKCTFKGAKYLHTPVIAYCFKFHIGTNFLFFFCICIGGETFQSFFLGDTSFSKESWLWVKYRPFEIKDGMKGSSLCAILCLQEGLQRCRRKKNCAHSPAAFSQWTSDTFHGPLILYQNVLTQILHVNLLY